PSRESLFGTSMTWAVRAPSVTSMQIRLIPRRISNARILVSMASSPVQIAGAVAADSIVRAPCHGHEIGPVHPAITQRKANKARRLKLGSPECRTKFRPVISFGAPRYPDHYSCFKSLAGHHDDDPAARRHALPKPGKRNWQVLPGQI